MEMHTESSSRERAGCDENEAPRFFAPARLSVRICKLRNDQGSQADNERRIHVVGPGALCKHFFVLSSLRVEGTARAFLAIVSSFVFLVIESIWNENVECKTLFF